MFLKTFFDTKEEIIRLNKLNLILNQQVNSLLIAQRKKGMPYKNYSNFEEALSECNQGYENKELTKNLIQFAIDLIEKFKSTSYVPHSHLLLSHSVICRVLSNKKEFRVLDFGGGAALHYYFIRNYLNLDIKLKWAVVETSAMCIQAKVLANNELQFFTNTEDANKYLGQVDLVFTSGAIQYCEKPYDIITKLVKIEAPHIFFGRTAFTNSRQDFIGIQEVKEYQSRYPFYYISYEKFKALLSAKYEKLTEYEDHSGYHLIEGNEILGNALLYTKI